MGKGILVVGSLNMDLVVHTQRHPQPGETVLGSDFQTFPGGKGANQAVAAARAGGMVRMVGRLGEDAFGDALRTNLEQNGVDTTYILRTAGASSGVALITLDSKGQNTIVVASEANWLLTPEDIQKAEAAFEDAAVLLLQLETPLESVSQAVALAKKHAVKVVLNPAPARPLPPDLFAQLDYLIPNESELALLSGAPIITMGVNALQSLGGNSILVTLGGNGVLVAAPGEEPVHLPGYTVPVVDTVAAGDAFIGAFAVALAEGHPLMEAAAWGNAAGAIAVTRPGAQPSLPLRSELDEFLRSHNR